MIEEIYIEAIQCNSELELQAYARQNLNRTFTDLEIKVLMKVIRNRKGGSETETTKENLK